MSKLLSKAIVAGLLVAVVFTTLALGTVEAWSVAIFQLIVLLLLLLWAAKAIVDRRLEIRIPPAALPLGGLVLVGLAQSLALIGSSGQTRSLSMDVEATRGAAAMIFFLFLSFLIAANLFDTHERLHMFANFLITFGLALAVFAMIQHFTWDGKMFWVRPTVSAGTGGPFVNRNHFAGYMEMLIPIPVALAMSRSARMEARLFWGFAAVIMSIGEAASLSRGGMVSLAAGLIFFAVMNARRRRNARPGQASRLRFRPEYFIVLLFASIIGGVVWIGADSEILKRLAYDPLATGGTMDRGGVWGDTLAMFRANPVLGVGLGAFETVYPIYGNGDGSFLVQFAHNDYLQVLSDGGLIGGALALWFVVVLARAMTQIPRTVDPFLRALGMGSAAGIFALLVHSLFDFNLQIPSNALLFLMLSAIVSRVSFEAKLNDFVASHA
jgi:O-antigen ligase